MSAINQAYADGKAQFIPPFSADAAIVRATLLSCMRLPTATARGVAPDANRAFASIKNRNQRFTGRRRVRTCARLARLGSA